MIENPESYYYRIERGQPRQLKRQSSASLNRTISDTNYTLV
jgi:hypothetical protein